MPSERDNSRAETPFFLLSDQIDGQKPDGKRQFGVGKDGSSSQRGLLVTLITLVNRSRVKLAMVGMPTVWTSEALRASEYQTAVADTGLHCHNAE